MGLVRIRYEVLNEVQLSRAFEFMTEQVKSLEEPFNLMADDFFNSMASMFSAEGAFEEKKRWQDLSPAYAKWKARRFPGRKILELTGRLLNSLTVRGTMDNVFLVTPTEMQVGTRVPYAAHHQTGTPKMPQRKIIELSDEQKKRWVQIMHKYLFSIYDQGARQSKGGV